MTTLLFVFFVSLGLSLVLTVVARKLGVWCGAVDVPDDRKVHDHPIPRTGGIAIFVSFFLALLAAATRATTGFLPQLTVSHHLYAALTWVVVGVLWLLWHRRRFSRAMRGE
jgi:UDP-N-acetylmuramyl pentapeptide phosphotransferase/UDP-N-acetylglucosamine-1-phosphate transferase